MIRISKSFSFLLLLLSLPVTATLADDTRLWLDRMAEAMRTKSYAGTFVYLHNNKLETMYIEHRKTSKGISERLLSLNGEAREIVRNESEVTCVYPDSKLVSVDKTRQRSHFSSVVPENLEELQKYYNFRAIREGRIANKVSVVVNVIPRDRYRYGYRLWIDKETHLLVRFDVLDEKEEPIEKMMFVDMRELPVVSDEPIKHQNIDKDFTYYEMNTVDLNQKDIGVESNWVVESLPPGFSLLTNQKRTKRDGKIIDQMVFSDGLSTVSVLIDKDVVKEKIMLGASKMGAVHFYGKQMGGHYITVVGEVPEVTVSSIAKAVRVRNEP